MDKTAFRYKSIVLDHISIQLGEDKVISSLAENIYPKKFCKKKKIG
jgi:hypothetical protein